MHLWNKLVCAVRGHYPFSDVTIDPPPPPSPLEQRIGGFQMNAVHAGAGGTMLGASGGGGGGNASNTISISSATLISPNAGRYGALEDSWHGRGSTEATLHISANALRSRLAMCARCHGMYWHTEPNLPAIVDSNNVPELKAYRVWKQRELFEQEQRRNNEAAARLYKQYQMVLKLAGPRCDDPEDRTA